ncbi:Leucine-rich repeat domain containing protein [Trema orientale]|uniref:Leucine-rich repeat domain containing protein n=1 Tax=Trema orientale TaxID=63057 RepID=A0A2P5FI83_TREOI|nr:Leucine-rich repeat domain containing protein [Trema orientale]
MKSNDFLLQSILPYLILHLIILTCLQSSQVQPLCNSDERAALLQFKDGFVIRRNASFDPSAYLKLASWTPEEQDDCCLWDGVECDIDDSARVIGLHLNSSFLYGSINSSSSLFRLSHLRVLNLADNHFNHSEIPPPLGRLSRLTHLNLSYSGFRGQIPLEISHLYNISSLDLSFNQFELKRPDLSTLVRSLSNLKVLHLSDVDISSSVPGFLANLSALESLSLGHCGLRGEFPRDIFQLPNLKYLSLYENKNLSGNLPEFRSGNYPLRELRLWQTSFSGHIPSSIGNLHSLNLLEVQDCMFFGPIPSSLGRLSNLQYLNFDRNHLSGIVDFNMFLNMTNLIQLQISFNYLTVLVDSTSVGNLNATIPKLELLYMASCNLAGFPSFVKYQNRVKILNLNLNHLHGKVPKWIWNTSIEVIYISDNFLTGFEDMDIVPSGNLLDLDISTNNLKGPLPIPPPSTFHFDVSDNELSGQFSPLFFNLSSLVSLDLSYNKLSGVLPEWMRDVNQNNLSSWGSQLRVLDLGHNQFQGRLPRSLASCSELEVVNLENNQLNDMFPSWLGALPKLKLFLLRFNHLHGKIISRTPSNFLEFPSLCIIDLSHNNFSGPLPFEYFQKWNAMKAFDVRNSEYLSTTFSLNLAGYHYEYSYSYSVTITNKGNDMEYEKILEVFTVIDLSSNKFEGGIPECLGGLQGLEVLNLSNNMIHGSIPSSLGNITRLESLDLSQNRLSGVIPTQLVQLTFLAFFSVASNRLRGSIPQGNQLSTFDSSSFEGNIGLCGEPLSQKCENPKAPSSSPHEDDGQDSGSSLMFDQLNWITIVPGFVGGLVVGVVIEHAIAIQKHEWFVKLNYVTV